jgi:uncharacterized membrane protein (DUF106 family)
MITCKNCQTGFQGKFCPECAQSASVHRFTIPHLLHEVFHHVTHVDSGALFLLRKLVYVPGKVAREYVEGKRKRYFNPFALLLLMIAVMVVVNNKTNIYGHFTKGIREMSVGLVKDAGGSTAAEKQKTERAVKELQESMAQADAANKKANDNSKILNLIFLPLLSLFSWLFFRKSGFNYAENLVMNVFVTSGYTALYLLVVIPLFLLFPSQVVPLMYMYILVQLGFCVLAYVQFFGGSRGRSILKGIVVQLLYFSVITLAGGYLTRFL